MRRSAAEKHAATRACAGREQARTGRATNDAGVSSGVQATDNPGMNAGAQAADKVDCWRNADQKHRWLATTLLDIEPRLRRVSGYQALPRLRAALEVHAKGTLEKVA